MHEPVLLQAVIEGLDLQPGLVVVDATAGRGGHSAAIAALIPGGRLIGIDQDQAAIQSVKDRLSSVDGCQIDLRTGNFRALDQILNALGINQIDRILFDLGWSSDQLALSGRGFSFQTDEPLLMTYGAELAEGQQTARQIVNTWCSADLVAIFKDYGDEPFARPIAEAIITARRDGPIETTGQLVAIIRAAVPRWYRAPNRRRHFATKIFQALRLAVNDEFVALAAGLTQGFARLVSGGRMAVIAFHSGEARLIKNFFRGKKGLGQAELITRHAIKPAFQEIRSNPRARSATLRILQKNI